MEKIEYKGLWWLPSNPDNQVAGILTLIPEKGIELELFDIFLSKSHDLVDTLNSYNNLVWPIEEIILGVSEKN